MSEWLAERGHQVTFINSSFFHQKRLQRFDLTTTLSISENFTVVCLRSRSYSGSISFGRVLSHRDAARSFREWLETADCLPDIIIASYPVVELCEEAVFFAKNKKVPVVIDCRDFWPDIFSELLPASLRWLSGAFFWLANQRANKALASASVICSHTASGLRWGLTRANRTSHDYDFSFPFTYPEKKSCSVKVRNPAQSKLLTICFLGTLSHRSGLEKYICALGKLSPDRKRRIKLLIGGVGPQMQELQALAKKNGAPVEFLGWLDQDGMIELMERSNLGLLPYDRSDFHMSIPNKFAEYLANGLPILSCTKGEVETFLKKHRVGILSGENTAEIVELLGALIEGDPKFDPDYIIRVYEQLFSADTVFSYLEKQLVQIVSNRDEIEAMKRK
ncbi:glycosyltransferase [Alphaproteobacteria bacterium]|nr:glycosyltransferase [Alphaproteobacteria bacterium]